MYFFLNSFYNPNLLQFDSLLDFFEDKLQESGRERSIFLGDFNINISNNTDRSAEYRQLIRSYGFEVINNYPTRQTEFGETLIDHFISNILDETDIHTMGNSISDHNMIFIRLSRPTNATVSRTDMKTITKRDYIGMRNDLRNNIILTDSENYDLDYNAFHEILINTIDRNTSTKSVPIRTHEPLEPWVTKHLLNAICDRNKLLTKQK